MNPSRPQAPGYLANLMARLFHEASGEGLIPLGLRPAQFPILIELWFGDGPVSRDGLASSQEMHPTDVDALLRTLVEDGLIETIPPPSDPLVLTDKANSVQAPAIAAARRANAVAAGAFSEDEMATFIANMNRVIDALQAAKAR